MKQIELKVVEGENGLKVDYKDLIINIAKIHPQGITVADMEKAVRVITAARKANGVLKLEDADWETLKTYLSVYPFQIVDEALIQFKNDIHNAPNAEIN